MFRFLFVKAFGLLLFLLSCISFVHIYALAETSVTLTNNTEHTALFCLNDVYKSSILPKSQAAIKIPTGSNKLDLIAVNVSQSNLACIYNYTATDKNGLPGHDDYSDIFYDYEDYFYTLNQINKPTTTFVITYQIGVPIVSTGATAIDLSAIPAASGYANTKICIDGVIITAISANTVNILPGVHLITLVGSVANSCIDSTSNNLNVVSDNTYRYSVVTNNVITNLTTYQAVADFRGKPQPPQQNSSPVLSQPLQDNKPAEVSEQENKKDLTKEEKVEEKKPTIQTEKVPEIIKYDKLTIDRSSKDTIEDDLQLIEAESPPRASTKNSTEKSIRVKWGFISIMTTILYICYDITLYLWKKSQLKYSKIRT
jgi:hypothetical protein